MHVQMRDAFACVRSTVDHNPITAFFDAEFFSEIARDEPDQNVVEGVRLLRSGGVVVVHRAALGGRAGDPAARDAEVAAVREAARLIAEDERLTPALVPLGDGLLAAVRD